MKKVEYRDLPLATRSAVCVALRQMHQTAAPYFNVYEPRYYQASSCKTPKEWMEFIKLYGTWTDEVEIELFSLMFAEFAEE